MTASVAGRPQHSLAEWLALHELDPATCRHVLDAIARRFADAPEEHDPAQSGYQALDRETAWLWAVAAMRDLLPEQQGTIDDTFAKTDRLVVDRPGKSRRAVTLDNGPGAYPTILFSYHGEPAEHLIMAHEFGHALQIMASRGKPMSPIMREVCAFLGEGALLSRTRRCHAAQHAGLAGAWRRDSRRYFGVVSERLRAALAMPSAPYVYSWNYPMARYLAILIAEQRPCEGIWRVFAGQAALRDVLQELT